MSGPSVRRLGRIERRLATLEDRAAADREAQERTARERITKAWLSDMSVDDLELMADLASRREAGEDHAAILDSLDTDTRARADRLYAEFARIVEEYEAP